MLRRWVLKKIEEQIGHFFLKDPAVDVVSFCWFLIEAKLMMRTRKHDFSWCRRTLLPDVNSRSHFSHTCSFRLLLMRTVIMEEVFSVVLGNFCCCCLSSIGSDLIDVEMPILLLPRILALALTLVCASSTRLETFFALSFEPVDEHD